MTRRLIFVWLAAMPLAALCVILLLALDKRNSAEHSRTINSTDTSELFFIGSSHTQSILPAMDPSDGILGDGRLTSIRAVDSISEQMSNALLADAIDSGVKTVFLEINAYTQNWVPFDEPAILGSFTLALQRIGKDLRRAVRFYNAAEVVRLGRNNNDQDLDCQQLKPDEHYRLIKIEPKAPDKLHSLLSRARDLDVEVIFFLPPRPQCMVDKIGPDNYSSLLGHVDKVAATFGIPLWAPAGAWRDEYFRDIHAHANVQGRNQFQEKLGHWYKARQ